MKKINVFLLILLLASCSNNSEIIVDPGNNQNKKMYTVEGKVETIDNEKVLPFNTSMNLTTYCDEAYEMLTPIFDKEIKRLHILFDRYHVYKDEKGNKINNLKVINDSYGLNKEIKIDQDLFNVLKMSIDLSNLTEGYFNPSMGHLIDEWNKYFSPFNTKEDYNQEFNIEKENQIVSKVNTVIPYDKLETAIELDEKDLTVKFNKVEGIESSIISLGALGKGYAVDYLRKEFSIHDTPLLISGSGSSSYMQGNNPHPDRDNWVVQINSPLKNELFMTKALLTSEVTPKKVLSTSGDYEQLFYYKRNDEIVRRHHILDPFKGYSNDYYRSITLYSKERSDILDGLSTALFNIDNLDNIKKIITNVETNYNIKIDYLIQKEINDNTLELYYNDGFKNTIIKYNGNDTTVDGITRVEL